MGNPKLFILSEQMRGTSFSLTLDSYTIGRADTCDLCISDPTVSGHHCTLVKQEDDTYLLNDEGSTNGTKVNNEQIVPGEGVILKNGDILQVGGVEILYDDIEGERTESRTISVINLDDTGTAEINKTAMKNLGDKLAFKRKSNLRENATHTLILNVIIGVLLAGAIGLGFYFMVLR